MNQVKEYVNMKKVESDEQEKAKRKRIVDQEMKKIRKEMKKA